MESILKVLPIKIGNLIRENSSFDFLQEIRIKTRKPIILYTANEEKILDYITKEEDMKEILVKLSGYSLYAYEEEIKRGYITIRGGHRVGIAGECNFVGGEIRTIRSIASINIRVSREVKESAKKIIRYVAERERIFNTIIVSPPKCGKTTMLRDLSRIISNGIPFIGLSGKKVTIIDERSEIGACFNGIPQMDVGIRTDILDNCLKKEGIIMAIRSLSPEVIICDEIGTKEEMEALTTAFNSGIKTIVTIHGESIEDIYRRKSIFELVENSVLERVIVLSNKNGVGTVESVYGIGKGGKVSCLK